ncbi:uncharacterized protein HaLaN_30203, partial [Haematococcus lacustris]
MGEGEDAQAAQPRAFTSPLQQQLYLQTRLGAPVFSPKFRKPQVAGQGVRAALPQLEKSFLAQKTQQLRSSLQAAIQVPSLRQDLPGPGFPNAELPPLEHKPPGIATVPLRGSGAKLSRAAERPPLQPGGLDSSQRVAPIKSAAQVLGPASELPYADLHAAGVPQHGGLCVPAAYGPQPQPVRPLRPGGGALCQPAAAGLLHHERARHHALRGRPDTGLCNPEPVGAGAAAVRGVEAAAHLPPVQAVEGVQAVEEGGERGQ